MDACDELGVLLYVDLSFTWNSATESFSTSNDELPDPVRQELHYQLQRASHHPAIVLWTGGNELAMATDRGWSLVMKHVMPLVASLDASRAIWPSCGPSARGWISGVEPLSARPNGHKLVSEPQEGIGIAYPDFPFDQDSHGPYTMMMNPYRPSPTWAWISDDVMPVAPQTGTYPRQACSVGSCAAPNPSQEARNCTPTVTAARTGTDVPGFFRSEFGAVSWSSFETMSSQLPPSQWGMQSPASLLRNHRGDNVIATFFGGAAAHPGTSQIGETQFQRQLYQSMIGALLLIKANIEAWRSQNSMGMLLWMLNDVWASGSWGTLEYRGRYKPLHYQLGRSTYSDQLATCNTAAACYVTNDSPVVFAGSLSVRLPNVQTGATGLLTNTSSLQLGAGPFVTAWFCGTGHASDIVAAHQRPTPLHCRPWTAVPTWKQVGCTVGGANCVAIVQVSSSAGGLRSDNVLPFQPPYKMRLSPNATVTAAVGRRTALRDAVEILLTASAPALYVVLTTKVEGRFSDNAMLVEGPRTVTFVGWDKISDAQLALLRSSLRVEHLSQQLSQVYK